MAEEAEVPEAIVADKYRLTRLLGRGGMGSVWEGVHVDLGTRVAVKFIDKDHAASEEIRHRFINEAKATARLRSKHVVQVYDQGVSDDGRPYIVMEFLSGEPLDGRLERLGRAHAESLESGPSAPESSVDRLGCDGRLGLPDTARILVQVARALTKAHQEGIIHRDLKPENVFLVWDDDDHTDIVKVVDFGIAKFTQAAAPDSSGSTRTGAVLGTPHYMSPEQARGLRTVDHRTDVWSLGVIAYRCVVGTLPFEGVAVGDLLVKICTVEATTPSSLDASLPRSFDDWVSRCLAKDPALRFQSAQELADTFCDIAGLDPRLAGSGSLSSARGAALQGALARAPTQALDTASSLTTTLGRTSASRSRMWLGLAAAGGVVGVGVAVALVGNEAPPEAPSLEPARSAPVAAAGQAPTARAEPVDRPSIAPALDEVEQQAKPTPSAEASAVPLSTAQPAPPARAPLRAAPAKTTATPKKSAAGPTTTRPKDVLGY